MKYVEVHLSYFFANCRWVFHTRSIWHCLKMCWGPIQMFYCNLFVADLNATFSNAITWMAWLLSLQDIDVDIYHRIWVNTLGNLGSNSQILKCEMSNYLLVMPRNTDGSEIRPTIWHGESLMFAIGLAQDFFHSTFFLLGDLELKLDFPGLHRSGGGGIIQTNTPKDNRKPGKAKSFWNCPYQ